MGDRVGGGGFRVDVDKERRIEVFLKIKKNVRGSGWGVRIDVNEELKFL